MSLRTAGLLLWLLVGGLAALAVAWQVLHPPQPPTLAAAAKRPPELPVVTPARRFQLPPQNQYGEIATRPLFIAARQPEPPPPPDEPPPKPPVVPVIPDKKLLLIGVIIAPDLKVALVRPEEPNAKTIRIKPGETVGAWRLETIFPNRVVMRKDQETQELALVPRRKPAGPRAGRAGAKPKPGVAPPPPTGLPVATPQPEGLPPSVAPPPRQ